MPIAALTFERLILENEVPNNINEWFIECLSKHIQVGSIREQVDAIYSNFSSNFQREWEMNDVFKKYTPYQQARF